MYICNINIMFIHNVVIYICIICIETNVSQISLKHLNIRLIEIKYEAQCNTFTSNEKYINKFYGS